MPAKKKAKKSVAKKNTAVKPMVTETKPHVLHTNMDHLPTWMIVSIIGGIFLVAYMLYSYSQTGMMMR